MGKKKQIVDVYHRIRVKLYPNNLPYKDGAYVARTANESVLSVKQVCSEMVRRGGFTGNYSDLVNHIDQFFREVAYQLCDGFAVNAGYFSIHPNIQGTFNSVNEKHNREKNPIDFRFRALAPLKDLVESIHVEIEGLADPNARIDAFIDMDGDSKNTFTPGNLFSITGSKIKIAGDSPDCGVFFVSENDALKAVKVTRIAENSATKITGIIPDDVDSVNRIEVRTQFTGSTKTFLREPRVIRSDFALTVA